MDDSYSILIYKVKQHKNIRSTKSITIYKRKWKGQWRSKWKTGHL